MFKSGFLSNEQNIMFKSGFLSNEQNIMFKSMMAVFTFFNFIDR